MIRVFRINPAPAKLLQLGPPQTELDCAAYDEAPEEYKSNRRRFPNKTYYSRKYVKDVLMRMHHGKCCYCETKLYTGAYLHVEHFRPKAAVRQSRAESNEFPGYYWLAYCWENLLLACFDCNTTYKNSVFPLENPSQRARSHNDELKTEHERFVNPTVEDPRDHIRFKDDLPVAQTERGSHTIEGLGLRRSSLTEQRLERLQKAKMAISIIEIVEAKPSLDNGGYLDEAYRFLQNAKEPDAAFSSMVMDLQAQQGL